LTPRTCNYSPHALLQQKNIKTTPLFPQTNKIPKCPTPKKKKKVQLGSPFFPMFFHALYPPFFLPFEFHLSLVSTSKKS
jgi:hypothetical protein